jgi:quinol monooxygenase YgiN
MYVVIVEFSIRDEFIERFRERVQRQARDSLAREADCHVFDVCIDPEREERVLLYEVYTNAEAFDAHLASSHFVDFDTTVSNWLVSKKVSRMTRL